MVVAAARLLAVGDAGWVCVCSMAVGGMGGGFAVGRCGGVGLVWAGGVVFDGAVGALGDWQFCVRRRRLRVWEAWWRGCLFLGVVG